ncbi:hypothetical protein ACSNOI_41110 [Actinomadura kijaniata]|uniref:hypothetical protein n=1 Tax=Actinomadura kijaniata TaxID=46161 RepID=UPI003F19B058
MTDRTASAVYPAEPADLFVQLYDDLPDELFRQWTATEWYADDEVRRRALELSEQVLDSGGLDAGTVRALVAEDGYRGQFTVLLGLDQALAHVNPFGPYHNAPALVGTLSRYLTEGRFNTDGVPGALLPRCAFPGRPLGRRSKADFFGVQRVPADRWNVLDHRILPAVNDPHFPREKPVAVGCAPMLETRDEVDFRIERHHRLDVYRLGPVEHAVSGARIETVLRRLDEAGAQIAVMPEATLTDEIVERWKEAAFRTAGRDRSRHPLRLILLGSGPVGGGDPPANRAVLIDRWTGEELLTQDKLSGFTLDARQLRMWRLSDRPVAGAVDEYVAHGDRIGLLDCSLGRLAVLICEDLTRSTGWEPEFAACGVSHLLVPIFSKPILRFRWEQQAAERQVNVLGSWSVVANSLAVGNAIPAEELDEPRYTCLVVGPEDAGRDRHGASLQFGRAKSADEIAVTDEGELPRVLPGAAHEAWFPHWS